MSINLSALMKQRYDTAANWTAQNPTLLAGEIGIESDTKKWKVGTGATAWTSLVYAIGGTYPIVNADIAAAAGIVDTKLATIATAGKVSNSATTAASANTASAIVARDASGNFTAGTITAALTGAASSNVLKAGDTMTGVLAVTAGTAALPGIAVSGDLNTGVFSPGADTLALVTGGTNRVHVTSGGLVGIGTTSTDYKVDIVPAAAGAALRLRGGTASSILQFTDSAASAQWGTIAVAAAASDITHSSVVRVLTASSERARIDSSGRLLVGTSSARSNFFNTTISSNIFQIERSGGAESAGATFTSYNTGTGTPFLAFARSNSSTAGTNTLVSSGQNCGLLSFQGNDGTEFIEAASIVCEVDGTPGANDMPGRLVFSTTADGAASPTEALRITNDRVLAYNQPTPATYADAATLTVADLKTKIITYTGIAATLTLPTGTLTEGGFGAIYTNMAFEWSVINTGAGICTIGAGTDHTIVGSATVAIGASARFASRRTAANTFVSYRLV